MKGPRGNRPELFEPGARIVYVAERRAHTRPDGSRATLVERARGVVESSTEQYVDLVGGTRVPKADVLGPDRVPEGERLYDVVMHHAEGSRIRILHHGRDAHDARERAQRAADRMFGAGTWTAGGARWLKGGVA